jgi:hypothetical protein
MSDIKKMMNNENVIFYNNDLEQLLAQSAEECESLGILHLASYEKYNKLSNIINIPVIILSSGIGFITGIDLNYDKMNIILGIGSVFVGIIKSIDSYFQLGKRAESHRMCALQYTQINKKIQIELSLCREQRQTAKDMLSIIKTDIKNLQDISPVIDQEIIKEYNLKYGKYKNVKKPNFVNGLSSVKVNANSLEQELASSRSNPQSIQSGAPSRAMSVMGDNHQHRGASMAGYDNFVHDFGANNGNDNNGNGNNNSEYHFPDLNANIVNDVAVNMLPTMLQHNLPSNVTTMSAVANTNNISRSRSPSLSRVQAPPHISNARSMASAQFVFANANNGNTSLQTPVSSSPIPTLRLQYSEQPRNEQSYNNNNNNNNNNIISLSRLSTPQLLDTFQQHQSPQSQTQLQQPQPHSDVMNSHDSNEVNLVIDIPDINDAVNNGQSIPGLNTEPISPNSDDGVQM